MRILHTAFEFDRAWVEDLGITPCTVFDMMRADPLFQTSPEIRFLIDLGYIPEPMMLETDNHTRTHRVVIEIGPIAEEDYTMFLLKFPR